MPGDGASRSTTSPLRAATVERVFVLGIDPGLSRCGYGVVARDRAGELHAEAAGVITTSPDEALAIRLAQLQGELVDLIAEYRPEAVVVERVFFQTNARTAMSVGQASGLALAAAAGAGCDVVQYTANEVKQSVVGYGSATKEQVQRMVQSLLRLAAPPRPADAADALALAICHQTQLPLARRIAAAQGARA